MKSLTPNTLLQNRYLIVQLIGKGGMGEVYLAVDQRLGSAVALKRTYFTDEEMLGDAFEREAKTLARLRHPVLPKVTDHFVENDNQYLVMDHISGDDLAKRLESAKKPFPLNWVLFWADQLLDALNYLHSYNPPIVHRDIKPQNLKLTDENHIVLLDFGLAKDNVGQTRITTAGSVIGFTPHYAPMEQIRGVGTNPKSDIYSLSATLYQLLANKVPHDALSRADMLLGKMPDSLVPINELNPEVSVTISEIIAKGMAISLDQRFSSAREMQKRLRDGYAKMQNEMSARTVDFDLKTVEPQTENIKQPETAPSVTEEIDQFATLTIEKPTPSSDTSSQKPTSTGDKIGQMSLSEMTETFGDSVSDGNISQVNSEQISGESVKENFNFSPSDDFSEVEEVYTDSDYNATNKSYTQPNYDDADDEYAENYSERISQTPPPSQSKKSGGKNIFAAGGLFVLLFLIVGAAGAGWYFYKNSTTVVEKSKPTPETTADIADTDNSANTEDGANADVVLSDDTNAENTESQPTDSTAVTNMTETKSPPPINPLPAKVSPGKRTPPPKTPATKQTPPKAKQTPKPKKDDRTVPLP